MVSLLERLLDTVSVLATPLFAAVTKKGKPKRAPARPPRKKARPAKKAARPEPTKKAASAKKATGRTTERPEPEAKPAPSIRPRPTPPAVKPVPPTGRAILLAPENGKFADSLHPKFRWLSVGGATRYEVAWTDRADWSDSHTIVSIATEAAVPAEEPLHIHVTYYWRVRGGNESGWGPWSSVASFQVLEDLPTA